MSTLFKVIGIVVCCWLLVAAGVLMGWSQWGNKSEKIINCCSCQGGFYELSGNR